ncbi:hypothetical protein ACX1C1_23630 [Paenibacillus sp. strain BS8-2]
MTQLNKLLVPMLIFTLVFGLFAGPIGTVSAAKPLAIAKEEKKLVPKKPTKGNKIEIPEYRSENAKHFMLDDGTFEMQVSKESIHYQDRKTKQWLDIDNTIVSSDKKGFAYKTFMVCRTQPVHESLLSQKTNMVTPTATPS